MNKTILTKIAVLVLMTFNAAIIAENEGIREATIRQDGTLLIDGKSFFPIGIAPAVLTGKEDFPKIAKLGFNTVVGSGDVADEFYENAAKANLYVIGGHYHWATFASHDPAMDLFKHEGKGFELAFKYKDQGGRTPLETLGKYDRHPSVIGWYIFEEPKANFSEPLEYMYEIFKSNSPGHIVTGVSAESVWYHHLYRAVDVLMVDVYPYRGARSQPEILTYDLTKKAVDAMKGKPVWTMVQGGCQWKNWEKFEPMSEDNYRNQAYLALIAGAKGYIMFSWPGVSHFDKLDKQTQQKQMVKIASVVRELKKLSPILCDGRVSDNVRIAWIFPDGKGTPALTRMLEYYGKHYLLVSNMSDKPVEAQILGTNYGFTNAFDVKVFTGPGLCVKGNVKGASAQTVNISEQAEFPTIIVKPYSSGAFEIIRKPAKPQADKKQSLLQKEL